MIRRHLAGFAALSAIILVGAGLSGASAQNTAPLPSMPMPPSASDPGPKAAKPKARKPSRKRAEAKGEASESASSADPTPSFERRGRFVPEEFDRGGRGGAASGGASPMMSPSGRPGMGMKF